MSDILVYNNWDPLEEIWLGDVYPENFYDDFAPEIQDNFCKITEWTKEDLKVIEKKLKDFNVIVRKPTFKNKNDFIDPKLNKLIKPPICPRDNNAVIGDTLYYDTNCSYVYTELASLYNANTVPQSFVISGAGLVKLGRDILFDFHYDRYFDEIKTKESAFEQFRQFSEFAKRYENDYRLHYLTKGGHSDSCFMPLRPGLTIVSTYFKDYINTLPDSWQRIPIDKPTYTREKNKNSNLKPVRGYKWRLPYLSNTSFFNKHIEKYCSDWIGDFKETFFEVNVVMLDENNMMCVDTEEGRHEPFFEHLSKLGINVHVVPWRTRTFWDGGLHCITLDVRRKAKKVDYFPERGENGIKTIQTHYFKNSESFYKEYNEWLEKRV